MPDLFDDLDAANGDPPHDYYGPVGTSRLPMCPNCREERLPSMGWHLNPETGEYECGPR